MTIKETALSKDGYIINQNNTNNIPYGNNISSYNGCGWIACYNLCKYLKRDMDISEVIKFLEKYLWCNGSFGTSLNGVHKFMQSLGLSVKMLVGKKAIANSSPRFGIIFYFHGKGCHYVFFYKYDSLKYRFLNVSKKDIDLRSLSKMLDDEVKCGTCTAFVV